MAGVVGEGIVHGGQRSMAHHFRPRQRLWDHVVQDRSRRWRASGHCNWQYAVPLRSAVIGLCCGWNSKVDEALLDYARTEHVSKNSPLASTSGRRDTFHLLTNQAGALLNAMDGAYLERSTCLAGTVSGLPLPFELPVWSRDALRRCTVDIIRRRGLLQCRLHGGAVGGAAVAT